MACVSACVFCVSFHLVSPVVSCNAHLQAGGLICARAKSQSPFCQNGGDQSPDCLCSFQTMFHQMASPLHRSSPITVAELFLTIVITWIWFRTVFNTLFLFGSFYFSLFLYFWSKLYFLSSGKNMCTHYSVLSLLRAVIPYHRKFMIFLQNECNKHSGLWVIDDRKIKQHSSTIQKPILRKMKKLFQCRQSTEPWGLVSWRYGGCPLKSTLAWLSGCCAFKHAFTL